MRLNRRKKYVLLKSEHRERLLSFLLLFLLNKFVEKSDDALHDHAAKDGTHRNDSMVAFFATNDYIFVIFTCIAGFLIVLTHNVISHDIIFLSFYYQERYIRL